MGLVASSPSHPLVDGHLDLAYLGLMAATAPPGQPSRDLLSDLPPDARGCVTLPALRRAGVRLVCATIFTESGASEAGNPVAYSGPDDVDGAALAGRRQLEWYQTLETQGAVRIVRHREDLPDVVAPTAPEGPLPMVILMECADPIRDPADAAWWVERGVRMVGLSWARGSRYSGGNGQPGPLNGLGREMVAALDELGVIHDVSHLSDQSFDDLLACARGPVVASHSNCRSITGESQRHLRDDQIRAIAARGGVVGLNLYGRFLVAGRRATLADAVAHVCRVAELGGPQTPALGSDLDGGFGPGDLPVDLDRPERLPTLVAEVHRAGVDARAFAWGNWMRVLSHALQSGPA